MIKRIKIRDFKSIREIDLELGPITVLVGRSGTGKSNLVQAIRFLRNLLLNHSQAVEYESGWWKIVPVGESKPKPTIEVSFTIPGEEEEYNYRIGFGLIGQQTFSGQLSWTEERLSLGKQNLFSRIRKENGSWEWETTPPVSPLPGAGAEMPMLGYFPSLQKIVFANAALSNGIGYYHFPASTLTDDLHRQHRGELYRNIPGLADDAANYLDIIRGITQDFHHPNTRKNVLASLQAVNPAIDSIELDSLMHPQRAVVGHKADGRIFALSLHQESDGLRRFYAHLLALYQTPSKLALVFEEPENAIFPGALSLLADEFKAAPQENRGQVIITTHSPTLLDAFDVDNIRVVEMRRGNTVVGPVSREQREAVKDHLLRTGELLTVDNAKLDEAALSTP